MRIINLIPAIQLVLILILFFSHLAKGFMITPLLFLLIPSFLQWYYTRGLK